MGLDVHQESIAVAVADTAGDVRYMGEIANTPEAIEKLVAQLKRGRGRRARGHPRLGHAVRIRRSVRDLSRAAPGLGALLTTLIGSKTTGFSGAVIASLALFVPSSLLAYGATLAWTRHHQHPGHRTAERGLAPVATGLILAGAFSVMRASSPTWMVWGLAAAALAAFLTRPNLNPLLVLFAAGLTNAVARSIFLTDIHDETLRQTQFDQCSESTLVPG